ncbi:hypothetical protein [Kibdelosporangium philippinense]|uniref:hypothetical protein n=1 Tax=Kibdelosporangium philippinense TaxID=211113 RepID=UPI00360EA7CA
MSLVDLEELESGPRVDLVKSLTLASNAPNLPLATAYRPHGAAARQRDRGHGSLRAGSPGKPAGHRPEHRSSNVRSASPKLLALAFNAPNVPLTAHKLPRPSFHVSDRSVTHGTCLFAEQRAATSFVKVQAPSP